MLADGGPDAPVALFRFDLRSTGAIAPPPFGVSSDHSCNQLSFRTSAAVDYLQPEAVGGRSQVVALNP